MLRIAPVLMRRGALAKQPDSLMTTARKWRAANRPVCLLYDYLRGAKASSLRERWKTAMKSILTAEPPMLQPTISIRLALVEDDPTQRESFLLLLRKAGDLEVTGEFATIAEAMEALPRLRPDVALVDISFPAGSGIELVRVLKPLLPGTQFMMLTVLEDADRLFAALKAGATGYLIKRDAQDRLVPAVREIHAGGSPMSSAIARYVVAAFQRSIRPDLEESKLSPREKEILDQLAEGRLYKEIADSLNIGLGTVRTHIRRMYERLHVRNRTEAVRRAKRG